MTVKQLIKKLLEMNMNDTVVVSVESKTAWLASKEFSVNEFSRSAILRNPDGSVIISGFANEGEIDDKSI
jgi:hypothetical protein